jgi:catechol 2,3-dioxygenase-like lactoylglutathione lyase family enzyme
LLSALTLRQQPETALPDYDVSRSVGNRTRFVQTVRIATPSVLGSSKIMAFVATRDPVRARAFYRDTLGLRLVSEELPFALVFDVNGTMLRVTIVQKVATAQYTVLGWQVPDIVATAKDLQKAGIKLECFAGMPQDELGIWQAPGGARVAWFKDPDGNTLSITQF